MSPTIKVTQSEHTRRLGRERLSDAQRGVDEADAGVRFDRLVKCVEQIERRLELRDQRNVKSMIVVG